MSQITPDGFTFPEEIHKRNNSIFWVVAVNKWNNENVVENVAPPYNVNSPHRGLLLHKCKKNFCPHKSFANFQIKSPHYHGVGGWKGWVGLEAISNLSQSSSCIIITLGGICGFTSSNTGGSLQYFSILEAFKPHLQFHKLNAFSHIKVL